MVGRRPRQTRKKRSLMGNHQKAWLRGRHAVLETLQAERWVPQEVVASDQLPETDRAQVEQLTEKLLVDFRAESSDRLTELCHARDHQGLIARMPEFPYADPSQVIASAPPVPMFVVLDSIQDPFNFGSILRSAGVFGADGFFVASSGQAEINGQVARSSAGAINRLSICRVESLTDLATELKAAGIKLLATSPHAKTCIDNANCQGPLGIVIGNEGGGVSDSLIAECDELVTIPQATDFESLNAAVSTGIALYEIHRQRR